MSRNLIVGSICVVAALVSGSAVRAAGARRTIADWHILEHPISRDQLTELSFGSISPWLQPWRSALTTRPASALLDAIGINFDVTTAQAWATARLLHASGFTRVRIEVPWDSMSYAEPWKLAHPGTLAIYLRAFRHYDLRPLILLNANSEAPGPEAPGEVDVLTTATTGARTVALSPGQLAGVVPGLSGFNTTDGYPENPGDLITSVSPTGIATLSRPLPAALPAGQTPISTLRFAPFQDPVLADGSANLAFQATMSGWLQYVTGAARYVRRVYGSGNFDVEVWNELTFGSAFLSESDYYSPIPDPGASGNVMNELLAETAQTLHAEIPGIQVGDGFSNEWPWTTGVNVPADVNAIDHHPYQGTVMVPSGSETGATWLNSFGGSDMVGRPAPTGNSNVSSHWLPDYRAFFPEYMLTGLQTETMMRNLSPVETTIYGTPHGADVHQPGRPAPQNWVTEDNLDQTEAVSNGMPAHDVPEMQAKTALRLFLSYASEGATAIDLYAADGGGCCQVINPGFFTAIDSGSRRYPATIAGPTMRAVRDMVAAFRGPGVSRARQLRLDAIAQLGNAAQFKGNGTAATPTLFNRDMVTFFPFQSAPHRFVVGTYVMTENITHRYTSHPIAGHTPFDMPPESYRLTISGVDGAEARVSASDPLFGGPVPVQIVSRADHSVIVQIPLTDSPRLLILTD